MSTTLLFLEHYTHEYTLGYVKDKNTMKFLIDNADKKEITEPEEWFLFEEGMELEDILEDYLDNHIQPVPDYTEEELNKTDFTKAVSVTFTLELNIDLCEDYGSCGASFWDQGDCPSKDHDKFISFIENHVKKLDLQEDEYVEEDLASEILYEGGDYTALADMIQWNYLNHIYSKFTEEQEKEKKKKYEHFLLPFYEAYAHEFHLDTFDEINEYTETELDSKRIMKFLIDNSENTDITDQEDAWELTEDYTIGSMVVGFLEKKILPHLPTYTEEDLEQTDFTKSVEVIFHLEMKVDMGRDSCYSQNNSGFWDMGGCEEEEEFLDYLIEEFEEESKGEESVRDNLADDCINKHDDPLSIEYAHIADIIQWRFLTARYAEFTEEN